MKILFNASTVKFGGGLTIALNLINSFQINWGKHNALIIAPQNCGYEKYRSLNIELKTVPNWLLLKVFRLILNYIWIRKEIKRYKPDIIFSLGNVALPTKVIQAHLLSNPFVIVNNYQILNFNIYELIIQKIRTFYFKLNLKYTDHIFAQTEVIKKALTEKFKFDRKITVIPMGYSLLFNNAPYSDKYDWLKKVKKKKLLCFTRYYQHKNLEILLELGNRI